MGIDLYMDVAQRRNFKKITDELEAAVEPFNLGSVTVYAESNFDKPDTLMLYLQISRFSEDELLLEVDSNRLMLEGDGFYSYVGYEFAKQLRAIPRVEPEDNIILGED